MKKGSVTENKNLLRESDYEKYQLVLPYRFLFGRRRQRFIYSELEKMHPCFSDEFCFDSNVRKFSRKGLVSDVLVIHKFTLAEYETRRDASGNGFFVSFCKHHRFFKDGKVKQLFLVKALIVVCVLFCVFFSMAGSGFWRKQNTQKEIIAEAEPVSVVEETDNQRFLIEQLFSGMRRIGGRILVFRWECNANYESLDAKVKEAFPEDISSLELDDLNMGAVNYENGAPVIQFSVLGRNTAGNIYSSQSGKGSGAQAVLAGEFYQRNRNILLNYEASLKTEKLAPYELHFICNEKVFRNIILGLAESCTGADMAVSSVSINARDVDGMDGAGDFEISIGCAGSAALAGVDSLAVVGENSDIFGEIKKSVPALPVSNRASEKKKITNSNKTEIPGARKIGEIKNSDGKVIRFYKTSEGKIKKIMEE